MDTPTPVQAHVIPQILAGRDVVAQSPTGSGKTAAFALPIIEVCARDPYGVFAVVVSPTRELADQIATQFATLGAVAGMRVCRVFGGMPHCDQARAMECNPHFVVATPGRLLEHMTSGTVRVNWSDVRFFVIDEVDQMVKEGFIDDVRRIAGYLPAKRQTLMFSATVSDAVLRDEFLRPGWFEWSPSLSDRPAITYFCVTPPLGAAEATLAVLLSRELARRSTAQVLVFAGRCRVAEAIALMLRYLHFQTAILHSMMPQDERLQALEDFRAGRQRVLVATDVASRGLDIPCVDCVIHYSAPRDVCTFVHRSGRTGRAGRAGTAILFGADGVGELEAETGIKFEKLAVALPEVAARAASVAEAKTSAEMALYDKRFGERERQLAAVDRCGSIPRGDGDRDAE